jgi:ERCC4-type nuclease
MSNSNKITTDGVFLLESDDREHEINTLLETHGGSTRKTDVHIKRLTWFDFAIYYFGELIFAIERKTWDDLAASIKDGRIDNQLDGMKQISEKNTNKKFVRILIIEGILHSQHGRIDAKNLIAKLDHIMFDKKIDNIIYTRDTKATVDRIYQLIDNYPIDLTHIGEMSNEQVKNDILSQVKEPPGTEKEVINMMQGIPGVSWTIARLLVKNKWSIMDIMTLHGAAKLLSETVFPSGRKMGPQVAKKIVDGIATRKCWVDMLRNVNGVTKSMAEKIITMYPYPEDWTKETLAKIPKSDKRVLGPAVAGKIMLLIWHPTAEANTSAEVKNPAQSQSEQVGSSTGKDHSGNESAVAADQQ